VSFLEIYNEDVCDLLSSNPRSALDVREDASGGAYAKGLQAFLVKSPLEMASVLQARGPPLEDRAVVGQVVKHASRA